MNDQHLSPTLGLTRRQFGKLLAGACTLGLLDPQLAALALSTDRRSLGWRASRTAGAQGAWTLTDIEGRLPDALNGTLYRVGPGHKENHGVALRHLFDGDAYVSAFSLREGRVDLNARFVNLPEREEELAAGKMLYHEFGTLAPHVDGPGVTRWKNQPSVNIIPWDGRLLGLSEGGHPTAVDPRDLSFQSRWDFHGTLPPFVSFTAHPKFDPATGEAYAYGGVQGPSGGLWVFRMEPDGRLTTLFRLPLPGHFMVHDMFLSARHLLFAIPPVKMDLPTLLSGTATVAEAMRYFESEPLRLVILRRDGTGAPVSVELPPNMVFHNGNAFERDGAIVLDTLLYPDGSVLTAFNDWQSDDFTGATQPELTRLLIDPVRGEVLSRTPLAGDSEFPRFDIRRTGEDARYLYTVQGDEAESPGVAPYGSHVVRHDLHTGAADRIAAGPGRALGEAVFVPRPAPEGAAPAAAENDGWLLFQGYDAARDENYLEIRDAASLEFEARVWTGIHYPLGFHGNFTTEHFIA
jgi:all-trans-8'-apo-beta-carotenal 15,15'-oxygenase